VEPQFGVGLRLAAKSPSRLSKTHESRHFSLIANIFEKDPLRKPRFAKQKTDWEGEAIAVNMFSFTLTN